MFAATRQPRVNLPLKGLHFSVKAIIQRHCRLLGNAT